MAAAAQRGDRAGAGVSGEGVWHAEAELRLPAGTLLRTGTQRSRDVVEADGLQPEEGGGTDGIGRIKRKDRVKAAGTRSPKQHRASSLPATGADLRPLAETKSCLSPPKHPRRMPHQSYALVYGGRGFEQDISAIRAVLTDCRPDVREVELSDRISRNQRTPALSTEGVILAHSGGSYAGHRWEYHSNITPKRRAVIVKPWVNQPATALARGSTVGDISGRSLVVALRVA